MRIDLSQDNKTRKIGDLVITLKDIITEEIAPAPGGESSYPASSGVTVYLELLQNGNTKSIILSQLSAPYNSKSEAKAWGYKINLLSITSDQVELEIVGSEPS